VRKSFLLLAAIAPLAALTGLAMPASAESGEGSCVTHPAAGPLVPLDLDAIPAKPVTGPLAVQGGGDDDECDDGPGVGGDDDDGPRAGLHADDDGPSGDDFGEDAD
jgi:hypothetical protein